MRNLMLIMKRLHICRLGKTFAAVLIILVLLTTYPKDVLFAQQSSSDSPVVTTSATPPPSDQNDFPAGKFYAARYGVDLKEAIYRLQIQENIAQLGAQLQEKEPDTFAGLWIQHEPTYRVIVQFTHDGTKIIQPYLQGIAFANLIEIRTAATSLRTLSTIYEENVAKKINDLKLDANSAVNVVDNRVDIYVVNPTEVDWNVLITDEHVRVVKVDQLPTPTAEIRAGLYFDNYQCTIGWNVIYAGARYVSTAGHCPSILVNGLTLSPRVIWFGGGNYDLGLYYAPSGYTLPNEWQHTFPGGWSRNQVTAQVSKVGTVGAVVCHIGAGSYTHTGSGFQCGTVLNTQYNWNGGTKWVSANYYNCGGDSGGPVFTDVHAYGMQIAGFQPCGNLNLYMAVDTFWELGVNVATTP